MLMVYDEKAMNIVAIICLNCQFKLLAIFDASATIFISKFIVWQFVVLQAKV